MKVKTSITLSVDTLKAIDRMTAKGGSRSETIERLLTDAFARHARHARQRRDLEIINRHAYRLNDEAGDVLGYQVESEAWRALPRVETLRA